MNNLCKFRISKIVYIDGDVAGIVINYAPLAASQYPAPDSSD